MSKLLKRLLQTIILPAAMIIVAKVGGLYLAIIYFKLDFFLETRPEGIYSIQLYFTNHSATLIANSWANISMLIVMTLFTAYFLLRYRLSLTSIYNPRTLVKLNRFNLLSWANKKGVSFLKVFVWIVFLWIACITIIADVISQNTFAWVGSIAFVLTILSTWILIRTFEMEAQTIYPESNTSNLY
jgi:hypothetical protein